MAPERFQAPSHDHSWRSGWRGRRSWGRALWWGLVLVVPAAVAIVVRLQRLVVTSDSVAQQSVVRTWFAAGHDRAYLPPDTWLLKLPVYLVVEALPLTPSARLLAESIVLAVLTAGLLAASLAVIARASGGTVRAPDAVLPVAWVATVGGGLGQYLAVMPNSRNVELGIAVAIVAGVAALGARTPVTRGRTAVLAAAATVALAVAWVDDPYIAFLGGLPLAVTCVAWFLLRDRDRRLLVAAAVLGASLLFLPVARRVLGLLGVEVVPDATGVTLSPGQVAGHLPILGPALASQVGLWESGAATLPARVTVCAVLAAAGAASVWLAVRGWRARQVALAFLGGHWLVVVVGVLVNRTIYDFHAGRYLVLAVVDLAVCLGVAATLLRRTRPRIATAVAALLAVATAANVLGAVLDRTPRPPLAALQDRTLAVVESTGATKGYSGFWAADLYTSRSGGRVLVSDVVCGSGRLRPRFWLTDSARLSAPATRTFVLWDPAAPDQQGCSLADLERQFGPAVQRLPAPAGGTILVYPRDVTPQLSGG